MENPRNTEQARMSIGVVERMTGINANTLRMWERRYQLGPSKRSPGGQREYTSTDIDHLRLIKKLIDHGMRIGDIAQLPTNSLTNLLLECGVDADIAGDELVAIETLAIGVNICRYFKNHIKRYPKLNVSCLELEAEECVSNIDSLESRLAGKQLLVIQQSALNKKHVEMLTKIGSKKIHIIVLYLFSHQEILQELERQGVILIEGNINTTRIDDAIKKVLRLTSNLSVLNRNGKEFDISMPNSHPRQFDDSALNEAEAMSKLLNCECPSHLSDLIRRLNAFEEYSKSCEAENWKQAAVHASVYSYTNQARYLLEKALQAVLDE